MKAVAVLAMLALPVVLLLFAVGLISPQKVPVYRKDGGTRTDVARTYSIALFSWAVLFGVSMEMALNAPGAEGPKSKSEVAAASENANSRPAQEKHEEAISESLGWTAATESVSDVSSITLTDGAKMGQVRVRTEGALSQSDSVRTWGTAIKEVANGAGGKALRHYERLLFFIEVPTQNGGYGLAAKAKVPTSDLLRLMQGSEASYMQYVDRVSDLELRPTGRRAAAAWCRENGTDTPGFCRVARR